MKIVIVKNVNNKVVTEDTLVLYFPGSFGCFHKGHMDIVHRAVADAKNITDDYTCISPAIDTPLTSGHSNFATNKPFDTNACMEQIPGHNIVGPISPPC